MAAQGQQKILIVDDDEHLLMSLGDLLRHEKYDVSTATSGEAALGILEKSPPDLIILDICMPGMNGIAFLKAMSSRTHCAIPVLVHTVRSNLAGFMESLCVGGFVPKPCESTALLEQIRGIMPPLEPPAEPEEPPAEPKEPSRGLGESLFDGSKTVSQSIFFSAGGQESYHIERSALDAEYFRYNEVT